MEVVTSATFDRWLHKLRDRRAAARVLVRVDRLAAANPGDAKPVGEGVSELRIDYGPAVPAVHPPLRNQLVVLLTGGNRSTQEADIRTAHDIACSCHRTRGDDA